MEMEEIKEWDKCYKKGNHGGLALQLLLVCWGKRAQQETSFQEGGLSL